MSFLTYTTGIPNTPNNPSNDQPIMKVNNDSNNAIWPIDHHGFNDNQGGWHNIIRMPVGVPTVPPAAISLPAPVGQLFVNTVGGDVDLFYESGLGIVTQLTSSTSASSGQSLKAWGSISGAGAILGGQSFGLNAVTPVTHVIGSGVYVINLSPGMPDTNYGVLISVNLTGLGFTSLNGFYTPNSGTQFTLTFVQPATGSAKDPTAFTFQLLHL